MQYQANISNVSLVSFCERVLALLFELISASFLVVVPGEALSSAAELSTTINIRFVLDNNNTKALVG